jgi:hypothetical protein
MNFHGQVKQQRAIASVINDVKGLLKQAVSNSLNPNIRKGEGNGRGRHPPFLRRGFKSLSLLGSDENIFENNNRNVNLISLWKQEAKHSQYPTPKTSTPKRP